MTVVRWTETAASDLESIRDSDYPAAGRVVPERNDPLLRELVRPPYRIVYDLQDNVVEILTVFHAARMFPADIAPPAR